MSAGGAEGRLNVAVRAVARKRGGRRFRAHRRRRTLLPPFRATTFRPAAWLPGPHAQTIAGRYLRRPTGVTYRRERLETPDGDFVDLDHAEVAGRQPPAGSPLAVVVHGLEGSAQSSYVRETCRLLAAAGIRAVALNFRTCGGEPNRTARLYHAGETEDLAFVVATLSARERGATLLAVGFSLGGNVLLKHLGEAGAASRIHGAVAVSVPFDLLVGARHLEASALGRLYTAVFLRQLRGKYHSKRSLIGERCDDARVTAARSFFEFDDAATAPLHGFAGAEDYYARSSSAGFLQRIRVPTLLIQSEDDPFLPASAIPREQALANPCITLLATRHGGHVGFIEGPPWAPRFWAEAEAVRYLAALAEAGVDCAGSG